MWLLANWKLIGGIVIGGALAGWIGIMQIDLAAKDREIDRLQVDLVTAVANNKECRENIAVAIKERLRDERLDDLTVDELIDLGTRWLRGNAAGGAGTD